MRADIQLIFDNIDTDYNGYIECEEFVRAAIDKSIFLDENALHFAFDFFDKDKDGGITPNEIEEILFPNGQKDEIASNQLLEIFNEADVDSDGRISFREFYNVMKEILKE